MVYVAVAVLVCLFTGIVIVLRFSLTEECRWKREFQAYYLRIEAEAKRVRQQLQAVINQRDDFRRHQQSDFLTQVFNTMPIDALLEFPGIGDATINRLRFVGLETITQLRHRDITTIDGLGNARTRDLQAAIKSLETKTAKKLTNPNDPLVQQHRALATERDRQFGIEQHRLEQLRSQAEGALNYLEPRRQLAGRITWVNHLLGRMPRLTPSQLTETFEVPIAEIQPVLPVPEVATVPPSEAIVAPALPMPRLITPEDILQAVAMLGLAMAKSDSRIAASERKQLALFLERRFVTTDTQRKQVAKLAETPSAEVSTLESALAEVKRVVPVSQHHDVYLLACSVADAAGERHAKETAALKIIEAELQLDLSVKPVTVPPTIQAPAAEWTDTTARQTLEIPPEAMLSAELIRRQYRLLQERYESRKFNNTDAEFSRLAESKRQATTLAAEWLIKRFNEPLQLPDTPKAALPDRHNPDLDAIFGD